MRKRRKKSYKVVQIYLAVLPYNERKQNAVEPTKGWNIPKYQNHTMVQVPNKQALHYM